MAYTQAEAYCPRCKVTTYYRVGSPHYRWCDTILVSLEERDRLQKLELEKEKESTV